MVVGRMVPLSIAGLLTFVLVRFTFGVWSIPQNEDILT
jgi:hypothetical protein